jgi:hypothetical protein
MNRTQQIGEKGVIDIARRVDCPNCGEVMRPIPKNHPLFNIQCTCCSFRAHVKTSTQPPKSVLAGAGWDILTSVLKCGYMVPPLIANHSWTQDGVEKREVRFFPFIPKANLKPRSLSQSHRQPGYKMFDYVGLDRLPHLKMEIHKVRLMSFE